jgi:hypothetical protein
MPRSILLLFNFFQGEKFVFSQTRFNDVLKNKLISGIFLGSENDFLSCKLVEELDKKFEKNTEIMSYMKKYSVEGVKNPWSDLKGTEKV